MWRQTTAPAPHSALPQCLQFFGRDNNAVFVSSSLPALLPPSLFSFPLSEHANHDSNAPHSTNSLGNGAEQEGRWEGKHQLEPGEG